MCEPFEIVSDEKDEKGEIWHEILHLWKQNPVECIHELIGNPAFRDHMQYIPEKVHEDEDGNVRIFDKMWTGEWWWMITQSNVWSHAITRIVVQDVSQLMTE